MGFGTWGSPKCLSFTQGVGHMGPGDFFPSKGAHLAFVCINDGVGNSVGQEDKGGWLLKLYKDQKKIMESFIRIAVVLDHIVNDLFNLNIFHKESPYFHKYVIST